MTTTNKDTTAQLDALATQAEEESMAALAAASALFASAAHSDETVHGMASALIRCEAAGIKSSAIIEAIDAAIVSAGKSAKAPSAATLSNYRSGYRFAEAAGFDPASDAHAVGASVTIVGNAPKAARETLAASIAKLPRAKRLGALDAARETAAKGGFKPGKGDSKAPAVSVSPVDALAAIAGKVTAADAELIARVESAAIVAALDALDAAYAVLVSAVSDRSDETAAAYRVAAGLEAETVAA